MMFSCGILVSFNKKGGYRKRARRYVIVGELISFLVDEVVG